MIFEPGDVLPPLVAAYPAWLHPGDVVWGCQADKGFIIDAEPRGVVDDEGPAIRGRFIGVTMKNGGTWMHEPDRLVLIEVRQ